jgi:hypothetical protein
MSIVMGRGSNVLAADEQERTQAGKHTDQRELRESIPDGHAHQWRYPELITEKRNVHLLSSINSASPLVARRKCAHPFSVYKGTTQHPLKYQH